MKKGTIKELAGHYGVHHVQMYGAMQVLTKLGVSRKVGMAEKAPGLMGKNSAIYEISIPKEVTAPKKKDVKTAPKKTSPKKSSEA